MVARSINLFIGKYRNKIIIFMFPILLAFLNSNWIFTPATDFLPDPWFYFAYFRYFYMYAPEFPSNIHYFVERLTWNVPGYYVYQLFPPLLANYVLHLTVCYIALFSLYGTLRILFNERVALISALLLGSYPWFLRAVGWDYVDGIGIALILLLIYILTIAGRSKRWRFYFFLAGIVHASLIITNLFWLGFAPSWVIYFALVNYPTLKTKILQLIGEASYFMLGNVILFVVVGLFYNSVTGDYNFLKNGLAFSAHLSRNTESIKFAENLYKHMPPYWHVIPVLVSILSIWKLSKAPGTYHRALVAIVALFALAYSWLIFWHYSSVPYMIIFLYSSFIIPATFLLLGALLAPIVDHLSDNDFNIVTSLAILVLAAPYLLVVIFPVMESWQGNVFILFFFSLIFLTGLFFSKQKAVLLPIVIAFSAMSFFGGLNSYVLLSDPLKSKNNFNALIDASHVIDSYYPNRKYTDFRLWFREDENYDTFFSLASLYLYPWGSAVDHVLSGKKPSNVLSFPATDPLKDGDNIVLVTSNTNSEDVIEEANRALAYRKAMLTLQKFKKIQRGSLQFILYFTKIKAAPDP